MSEEDEPIFIGGRLNWHRYGMIQIRSSSGEWPRAALIEEACAALGRVPGFRDNGGYDVEMIAAAINPASGAVAYVETRAREGDVNEYGETIIDVTIKIHNGTKSADIESYNPYFGCDVRFFHWFDDVAVLIYREKHRTYLCRFNDIDWPPSFVEIGHKWLLKDGVVYYVGYKPKFVGRISVPDLQTLEPIALEDATNQGVMPE